MELSRITNGPVVNESFETNQEGIFACGNVLHVHDLVDNVSMESHVAGKNAVNYIMGNKVRNSNNAIEVVAEGGVRYTVP